MSKGVSDTLMTSGCCKDGGTVPTRFDEAPSGRGNIKKQNTYLLECSLLHIFREKESL